MNAHVAAVYSSLVAALITPIVPVAHAEVYKWVDEKGQTHYGERKPGTAPAAKVKIQPSAAFPAAPPAQGEKTENWLRPQKPNAKTAAPPAEPVKRSRTGGRDDGTDASRCALARDVLDGNLQHANGSPIDQHDIDVAKNDVKLFCKSR